MTVASGAFDALFLFLARYRHARRRCFKYQTGKVDLFFCYGVLLGYDRYIFKLLYGVYIFEYT